MIIQNIYKSTHIIKTTHTRHYLVRSHWTTSLTVRNNAGNSSVDPSAVCPNLSLSAGQNADVSHLDHRGREGVEESVFVGGEGVDDGSGVGAGGGEEDLVGDEESVELSEVGEVFVVEGVRGRLVEVGQHQGITALRADLPKGRQEGRVQSRVGICTVESADKSSTASLSKRVSPCVLNTETDIHYYIFSEYLAYSIIL